MQSTEIRLQKVERPTFTRRPSERAHHTERRSLYSIPFKGFSPGQKAWVRKSIHESGLPIARIRSVQYDENTPDREIVLGSWGTGGENEAILTLYKSLSKLPPIAQAGTITHELAHAASPFRAENVDLYPNKEHMETVQDHVTRVAMQTHITGKYLGGYHKALHKRFVEGEIDWGRFVEETHAILIEQRMSNPNHLTQVEQAQKAKLEALQNHVRIYGINGISQEVAEYVTGHQFISLIDGVNATLLTLIPKVRTIEQLNSHIERFRRSFDVKISPLSLALLNATSSQLGKARMN